MRDGATDDGLGLPDDADASRDAGVDVDLDFLADVESMNPGMDAVVGSAPASAADAMTPDDVAEFRARWADVQASFIDNPSRACEQADNLVDLVLTRLTERLTRERDELVRSWDRGSESTDTEELRVAMKGYRGLIDRLLTAEL